MNALFPSVVSCGWGECGSWEGELARVEQGGLEEDRPGAVRSKKTDARNAGLSALYLLYSFGVLIES
jgi:hypothetical protein